MTELKPCPHCGSTRVALQARHPRILPYFVECSTCDARGARREDREAAIAAWNRRPVTREQVEAAARSIADGLFFAHEIDAGCEHSKDFAIFAFRAAGFEVEG
ncbi:hypothetical protein DDE01_11820 [Desulfovibrio desulfuricans]|nr:hypothetical protein DDE01_11820 [Desulfovibrio desulfuricans]